jgi:hypothetical protein
MAQAPSASSSNSLLPLSSKCPCSAKASNANSMPTPYRASSVTAWLFAPQIVNNKLLKHPVNKITSKLLLTSTTTKSTNTSVNLHSQPPQDSILLQGHHASNEQYTLPNGTQHKPTMGRILHPSPPYSQSLIDITSQPSTTSVPSKLSLQNKPFKCQSSTFPISYYLKSPVDLNTPTTQSTRLLWGQGIPTTNSDLPNGHQNRSTRDTILHPSIPPTYNLT